MLELSGDTQIYDPPVFDPTPIVRTPPPVYDPPAFDPTALGGDAPPIPSGEPVPIDPLIKPLPLIYPMDPLPPAQPPVSNTVPAEDYLPLPLPPVPADEQIYYSDDDLTPMPISPAGPSGIRSLPHTAMMAPDPWGDHTSPPIIAGPPVPPIVDTTPAIGITAAGLRHVRSNCGGYAVGEWDSDQYLVRGQGFVMDTNGIDKRALAYPPPDSVLGPCVYDEDHVEYSVTGLTPNAPHLVDLYWYVQPNSGQEPRPMTPVIQGQPQENVTVYGDGVVVGRGYVCNADTAGQISIRVNNAGGVNALLNAFEVIEQPGTPEAGSSGQPSSGGTTSTGGTTQTGGTTSTTTGGTTAAETGLQMPHLSPLVWAAIAGGALLMFSGGGKSGSRSSGGGFLD